MTLKFSQITASLSNFTTTDVLLGVQNATADRLLSFNQISSGLLTSATLSGATLNTATLNNATINTAVVNGWLGVGTTTPGTALDVVGAIRSQDPSRGLLYLVAKTSVIAGTVGTLIGQNAGTAAAQIDFAVAGGTSLGAMYFYTYNNNVPSAAMTINASAIVNIGTAQITTILSPTINTAVINNSLLNTAVLINATINTATINGSLINPTNATAGYVLRSNGTVLAPTWAGGKTLLNTLTASNVASTTDTTSFTSQYSTYEIEFENLTPISTATLTTVLNMQISTTGTNWAASNYAWSVGGSLASTVFAVSHPNTTQITLGGGVFATAAMYTAAAIAGVNGWIKVKRPSGALGAINGQTEWFVVTGEIGQASIGATNTLFNGNTWVGVAFYMSTGTISGTVRIYGIS